MTGRFARCAILQAVLMVVVGDVGERGRTQSGSAAGLVRRGDVREHGLALGWRGGASGRGAWGWVAPVALLVGADLGSPFAFEPQDLGVAGVRVAPAR